MSEPEKMVASLSGAFVAHLLLLLLVFAVPGTSSIGSSTRREPEKKTREVTVLMGDLMERLERERPEPEKKEEPEAPQPEPSPASLPFVATDLNRPEASAPEKARFESDRNTSAASRLRPDESLPQADTPTLAGESPLPHLTLANREFVEGPPETLPASPDPLRRGPSPAAPGFPPAASASPSASSVAAAAPSATAPPVPSREASALEALPPPPASSQATEDSPGEAIPGRAVEEKAAGTESEAEISRLPGRDGQDVEGATRQKSFLAPGSTAQAPVLPDLPDGDDRLAAGRGSGREGERNTEEAETAADASDPLDPASREGAMAVRNAVEPSAEDSSAGNSGTPVAAAPDTPPSPANPGETAFKSADDGLFAKGFSPEEKQNVINGSLAKEGADAVDAVDTPMGRYKKVVRDAISAKWHRYRQDNADFVTWGILKVEFSVDPSGRVRNLRITKNEANAMLAEFSLRAIRDAKLPPMPEEVAASVGSKGLVIQYDIIIY